MAHIFKIAAIVQFQEQRVVIARESRRDDRSNLVFGLPRQKIVKQYLPRNDEGLL